MSQMTANTGATTEVDTTSDKDEQSAPRWRRPLKSGLLWTGATTILNKVTWSHLVSDPLTPWAQAPGLSYVRPFIHFMFAEYRF